MSGDDVCSSHCAQQSERPPSPDWTSAAAINKWLTDLSWWYQCVLRLDQPPPPVHPSVLVSPVSFSTPIPSPASPVPKRRASVCCLLLGWMMICCCHHVIVSVSVCVGQRVGLVVSHAMHCTHTHTPLHVMSRHCGAVFWWQTSHAVLVWSIEYHTAHWRTSNIHSTLLPTLLSIFSGTNNWWLSLIFRRSTLSQYWS